MLSKSPRAPFDVSPAEPAESPALEAPEDLVARYVELTAKRRAIEDELAYVRAELELLAASSLGDARPRGRFVSSAGHVAARLQPTCVFDRGTVGRLLQREGRLVDVATITGPSLARFLAKEPALAARLSDHVRHRRSVVLMAANR